MPKISLILNNREQNIQNNLIKAKSIKEESIQLLINFIKSKMRPEKKQEIC